MDYFCSEVTLKRRALLLLFLCIPLPTFGADKVDKVLVLAGGGLHTAAFLGAIEGAKESGYDPNVLLTTCGASLAGAIANQSPDPKVWRDLIESPEFYEFMKSVRVNPKFREAGPLIKGLADMKGKQWYQRFAGRPDAATVPDLVSRFVVDLPLETSIEALNKPFKKEGIRLVIIAGRVDFDPKQLGKQINGRKLFPEALITAAETAHLLDGKRSSPAENFPHSNINPATHTYTGIPLYQAVRASMSEPGLVQPGEIIIDGKRITFTAGSIDSYPVDLANAIGNHVVATASGPQGDIENIVYQDAFGIPLNERGGQMQRTPIDHWMDFTDWSPVDDVRRFGPKLDFGQFKFVDDFPATHEEFLKTVRLQWAWGKQQAIEALKTKKGDRSHLRDDQLKSLGKIGGNGIIDATADIAHVVAAPAAVLEAIRGELSDNDDPEAPKYFPSFQNHWSYLATYAALTFGSDWLRRRVETRPTDIERAVEKHGRHQSPRLVVNLRGGVTPLTPGASVIFAHNPDDLINQLKALEGKYGRIDLMARRRGKFIVFADGTKIEASKLREKLWSSGVSVALPDSVLVIAEPFFAAGSKGQKAVSQLGDGFLREGGAVIAPRYHMVLQHPRDWVSTAAHWGTKLVSYSTGIRMFSNGLSLARHGLRNRTRSAQPMADQLIAPNCNEALGNLALPDNTR